MICTFQIFMDTSKIWEAFVNVHTTKTKQDKFKESQTNKN